MLPGMDELIKCNKNHSKTTVLRAYFHIQWRDVILEAVTKQGAMILDNHEELD